MRAREAAQLSEMLATMGYTSRVSREGEDWVLVVTEAPFTDISIRVGEAARMLGVGAHALRRWADRGLIEHHRVGDKKERRFSLGDLQRFLEESRAGDPERRMTGA